MRNVMDDGGIAGGRLERALSRASGTRVRALALAALVGLLALSYLQVESQVAAKNARLTDLRAQSVRLEREKATLRGRLGVVTSPAYVDEQARKLGLAPSPAGTVIVIPAPAGGRS